MNAGADVRSLDALRDWHAAVVDFRGRAQNALTSLTMSLQRAADWLADQRRHWQREIRKAEDAVYEARTALRNKQYQDWGGKKPDTTVEEKALARATARLQFAEERLEATRQWERNLPGVIQDTCEGPIRNLGSFLDGDLPRALALLARQVEALEGYTALAPEPAAPVPLPESKEQP